MLSLLWKEWHEQAWKLGFASVVLGAVALIGLHARIVPDESMLVCVCFLGMALLPVLSATGLVPAERSEGSFEMLMSLPVSARRILLVKTILGLLQCIIPMTIAALLSCAIAWNRELAGGAMLEFYLRATLTAAALFMWMHALTIHLPNETRAALLAVGLVIFWCIATGGLAFSNQQWLVMGMSISPLAFMSSLYGQRAVGPPILVVIMAQICIAVLLWLWAASRMNMYAEDRT